MADKVTVQKNMSRRTVLVDSADPRRRDAWSDALRRSGCLPLPAATLSEAREWVHSVCPDLVLVDAALPDGRAVALLQELRGVRALARVPVIVRGAVTLAERRYVARDPHAQVRHIEDLAALTALVDAIVHAA